MFNFGLKLNKSPKQEHSKGAGGGQREATQEEKEFSAALSEGEKQIVYIEEALASGTKMEELKKITEKVSPLIQYLKTVNYFIPENMLHDEDLSFFIDKYDNAIYHVKNFSNEKELNRYLKEIHELVHQSQAA